MYTYYAIILVEVIGIDIKKWSEIYEVIETEYKKCGDLTEYSDKDAALICQTYHAIRDLITLDKFGLFE